MSARDLAATVRTDIMRLADGETTEEMLTVEARALDNLAALEKQAADAQAANATLAETNRALQRSAVKNRDGRVRAEEALRQTEARVHGLLSLLVEHHAVGWQEQMLVGDECPICARYVSLVGAAAGADTP